MDEKVRKAIENAKLRYIEVIHRSDTRAMASLFTEDVIYVPQNFEMIRGREGIEKFCEFQLKVGLKDVVFASVDMSESGNTVCEVCNFTTKTSPKGQKPFEEKLRYICIWKQVDSVWKMHRAMWNSGEPPEK
jgi:ketosteroid isomerase-like protein